MFVGNLKKIDVRQIDDVDVLVAALADLKTLKASYDDLKVEVPQWIASKEQEIHNAVNNLTRADKESKLEKAKARREALMTSQEKRDKVQQEIDELEKSLK